MDASTDVPGAAASTPLESITKANFTRRQLLKSAGVGVAGAALAPIYVACAPFQSSQQAGGKTLSIMQWNHFVPAYDSWFDKYAQEEWGPKNNIKVTVDHVNNLELPGRLAGEAAGKTGHDIIQFAQQIQTFRFKNLLVDMGDVVDFAISKFGQPVKMAKDVGFLDGVWRGMPDFYIIIAPMVREDLLQQVGGGKIETWEDVRAFAKATRQRTGNKMAGLAISHCNDANHNWRAIMWCYGASEVQEDGKTLSVDTKQFRDFLQFAKAFYTDAITPEVFAWDDVSDNRYLGSGEGSFIHDAISSIRSIQGSAKDDPKRIELYNSISIRAPLKGPGGQHTMPDVNLYSIWNFSKNVDTAKQFLKDYISLGTRLMKESLGYNMPFYENLFQKPMAVIGENDSAPPLGKGDKKYEKLQDYKGSVVHTFGYPGPPNAAAQSVLAEFHIPDIVGIYVRGNTTLEDTIKEAKRRLQAVYDRFK